MKKKYVSTKKFSSKENISGATSLYIRNKTPFECAMYKENLIIRNALKTFSVA